jgi:galactokinase/mevalonate kinase-like predicted kinase
MLENSRAQAQPHPDIVTPELARVQHTAWPGDATHFKISGTGGRGSAVILSDVVTRRDVENALREAGYRTIDVHFDTHGLRT